MPERAKQALSRRVALLLPMSEVAGTINDIAAVYCGRTNNPSILLGATEVREEPVDDVFFQVGAILWKGLISQRVLNLGAKHVAEASSTHS